MSHPCQLEMHPPAFTREVFKVTVRIMCDKELSRFEVLHDL